MKKHLVTIILCVILSVACITLAETTAQKVAFNDFEIVLDKVEKSGKKVQIQFSAYFNSEDSALSHDLFIAPYDLPVHDYEEYFSGMEKIVTPIAVSFVTLTGEEFLDIEQAFQFGIYEATTLPDGRWKREIEFISDDYDTDAEGVVLDFYVLDGTPLNTVEDRTVTVLFPQN